ncbi:MAG: hypothetical protein ACF8R7_13800 [Phycisphaerales bacterium JB039]
MVSQAEYDRLRRAGRWSELEDKLRLEIRDDPSNHWLLTTVATACHEQRRYREAKEWSDLAYAIMPECPLVRWDRACIYWSLGDTERAIAFWERLAAATVTEQQSSPCWESEQWNQALNADCWHRLAIAYAREGRWSESDAAAARFEEAIAEGVRSHYTAAELHDALEKVSRAQS